MVELAGALDHRLPSTDPDELARWFDQGRSGSLETYLGAFVHTVSAMQTIEGLRRVAEESVEDLAADGVVYAELRFAPLLHTRRGLPPEEVVEAVIEGMSRAGERTGLSWGLILDAIRSEPDSLHVADLAVRYAGRGVVAFDLSGPEAGFPPDAHLPAIRRVREVGLGVTLHAGEAAGVASIALALNRCGADRIGHGIEVIRDCAVADDRIIRLGAVAAQVRDRRVPLEVCPTSNLHTRGWAPNQHPVGPLHRAGFTVTINTDNRLMSATSMSAEQELVRRHQGFGLDDLALATRRALAAAFCPEPLRRSLWEERIAPAYSAAGASVSSRW